MIQLIMKRCLLFGILFIVIFVHGCIQTADQESAESLSSPDQIIVTSPAFSSGSPIPGKYTCDGEDSSPEISWTGVPEQSTSLVLIMDDPDAPTGTFTHWVVYNIPPYSTGFASGVESLPAGTKQGLTDFGRLEYGGPCPPKGTHRYYFRVYALDIMLKLAGDVDRDTVFGAMEGHVIAQGELMGTYSRLGVRE